MIQSYMIQSNLYNEVHVGMSKIITNIKFAWLNWVMILVLGIHKNGKLIQLFQAVKQSGSRALAQILSLPIKSHDYFVLNVSRMAWSFEFLFCTTVQHHDWNQGNKYWSLLGFRILCGCLLKSSLLFVLSDSNV